MYDKIVVDYSFGKDGKITVKNEKWYIITNQGLYRKQTYTSASDAVSVVANECCDSRRQKRVTRLGEGLYQYFYNTRLFLIMEEKYAIGNGYEWVVAEINK